jgi:hypothetical protein
MDLKSLLLGGGKDRIERVAILGVMVGVLVAGLGTAFTVLGTKGVFAGTALLGSFITFVFTVILVFYWFARGDG